MTGIVLYLAGTLVRGLLVFAGAMLTERFAAHFLARGGRLVFYYLLLLLLLLPLPGTHYTWPESVPAEQPQVLHAPIPRASLAALPRTLPPEQTMTLPAAAAQSFKTLPPKAPFPWQALIVGLWLAGAAAIVCLKFRTYRIWKRRIETLQPIKDERVKRIFCELQKQFHLEQHPIALLDSDPLALGTCCFGLGRPSVLFPSSKTLYFSEDQLKMLLTHELAHIRRHDLQQRFYRNFLKIPLFFNPFLWFILKRLDCAAELACDDAVIHTLQLTPEKRRSYGKLLLDLAAILPASRIAGSPGIRSGAKDLQLRLQEAVSESRFSWFRLAVPLLGAVLIGAGCMLAPASSAPGPSSVSDLPSSAFHVIEGEFELTLELEAGAKPITSRFQYMSAVDNNGEPIPSAGNMVFYSSHINEKIPFKDKNNRYYAEKLGWTIYSIPDMEYTDSRMVLAGQDELVRRLKLPKRKLLMFGASSGATNAVNASLLYPERFDAIAALSPRRWYPEKKAFERKDNVVRLLAHNWDDGAGHESQEIQTDLEKLNMPGIFIQTPPNYDIIPSAFFHRAPHDFTKSLFQKFFQDIVQLRDANGGVIPPPEQWKDSFEQADGRTIRLPGKRLQPILRALPNELIGKNAIEHPLFFPAVSGKPAGTALLLIDPQFKNPMKLMDTLYYLATAGNVNVYALELFVPETLRANALECLNSIQDKLPLYVVALGRTGDAGISAAAATKNSAYLVKVSTIGTVLNSTLAAEAAKKPALPVVMYFDAPTASNDASGQIIGVNTNVPIGFGKTITALLEQSVRNEEIAAKPNDVPPVASRLPKLIEETTKQKKILDPAQPETIKAYIAALEKVNAETKRMQQAGVIDSLPTHQAQIAVYEAMLEYAGPLRPTLAESELDAVKLPILERLLATYKRYATDMQNKGNFGRDIDQAEWGSLLKRYAKTENELKILRLRRQVSPKPESIK